MITKPDFNDSIFFLVIYALSAISGGLGGCVVWSYYTKVQRRAVAFVLAYMIIGLVFGIVSATFMMIFHSESSVHQLILYSMLTGFGGTMAVFGVNWGAGVAFKWRNLEVKFTIRKPTQERRDR